MRREGPHASRPTPHASLKLAANQVSRVPETGRPLPLLVISGLATHGDGLRFLFNALPTLPLLARTVSGCVNSAFPIHFYTIYGPSVQTMDTQLNALPTHPVLARTVSGHGPKSLPSQVTIAGWLGSSRQ